MVQYPYDFIKWNYPNDTIFSNISFVLNRNNLNDTINNIASTKTNTLSSLSYNKIPTTEITLFILSVLSIILLIGFISNFQYYKQLVSGFYLESKRKNFLNKYPLNHYFNFIVFFIYILSLYIFVIYDIYIIKNEFEFLKIASLFLYILVYKILFFLIYSYLFENKEKRKSDIFYYISSCIPMIFIVLIFLLLQMAYSNELIIQIAGALIIIIFIYRWTRMNLDSFKTIKKNHIIYFLYFCTQEIVPFLVGYSYLNNII
jgi:hypothetical protein